MKLSSCLFAMTAAMLAGCAPDMRAHIAGFDGRAVDPVSQERFVTECTAKAQVAKSSVPYTGNSIGRAIEMGNVENSAFQGCMAEKGLKVTYVPVDQTTSSVSSAERDREVARKMQGLMAQSQ